MKTGTPHAISGATPVLVLALAAEKAVHNEFAKEAARGNA